MLYESLVKPSQGSWRYPWKYYSQQHYFCPFKTTQRYTYHTLVKALSRYSWVHKTTHGNSHNNVATRKPNYFQSPQGRLVGFLSDKKQRMKLSRKFRRRKKCGKKWINEAEGLVKQINIGKKWSRKFSKEEECEKEERWRRKFNKANTCEKNI